MAIGKNTAAVLDEMAAMLDENMEPGLDMLAKWVGMIGDDE